MSGTGTTTVYIFSGSKDIAEYDNGAVPTSPSREYIYAAGRLVATLTPAQGGGTTAIYHHADHLSVRVTTDASGNKIGEQGHYPYGEQWYVSGTTTKFFFTTYERDGESGNDYALARFYINRFGRFCSMDPVDGDPADPQSWNHYVYARDNPVNLTDPSGKFWGWLFGLIMNLFSHIWQGLQFLGHTFGTMGHAFEIMGEHAGVLDAGPQTVAYSETVVDSNGVLSLTGAMTEGPVSTISINFGTLAGYGGAAAAQQATRQQQQQPLKQRLANDLKNPDCAALLGGPQKVAGVLKHFSGTIHINTDTVAGHEFMGDAWAQTPVPPGGNFAGGRWTGPNFSTYVGNPFMGLDSSVQETEMIHELIHAARGVSKITHAAMDMMRPNVPGLAGNRTANLYDINKDCGTALPPNW